MSKERLFGTDGVRGVANEKLTADLAMKLGMAAGNWIHQNATEECKRPFVVIGCDTRISGDMLGSALSAGLSSLGVDSVHIGVVPTPAVSQITRAKGAAAGIVISASHNPYQDNGIKFFGADGKKLSETAEDAIESALQHPYELPLAKGEAIGRISNQREFVEIYFSALKQPYHSEEETPLKGLRLVMDCANGAACGIAPQLFGSLGAELILMNNDPNGVNINVACGSTCPIEMATKVRETGADAGLAFDGDADRVIMADETGTIIDGDRMMATIARRLKAKGLLEQNLVVATIMSNVGLEKALEEVGIRLLRTKVGDKYVAEAMDREGAIVGGEQSGHILLPHVTPTGDGLVTALQVLAVMRESQTSLSSLTGVVKSYPQLLKNVRVESNKGWNTDPDIQAAIAAGQAQLENPAWLSVRPSGTEPLIRVMAQGTDQSVVENIVYSICAVVERKLGGSPHNH